MNKLSSLAAVWSAVFLVACGGGGGSEPFAIGSKGSGGSGGTPGQVNAKLSLSLVDAQGASNRDINFNRPLTAKLKLTDAKGVALANTLIAFNADANLVKFDPNVSNVLTDAKGEAQINLKPASLTALGAGLLKAVAALDKGSTDAQISYQVTDSQANLRFATSTPMLAAYSSTLINLELSTVNGLYNVAPVTLKLESNCLTSAKASFPNTVSSVDGRFQFEYRDQGCAGGDVIRASIEQTTLSAQTTLRIAPPDAFSLVVGDITPQDRAIVIRGASTSGRSEVATVKFRVLDRYNKPIAKQNVTFALLTSKPVALTNTSAVSDEKGEVSATISSGSDATSVRVVAKLDNGLSAISDTIMVTTGLPIQAAFSLSSDSYNIEGFDYDNTQTQVTLLLADQNGNPISDNTATVFQTDSGAIGSSMRGGCVTNNGVCSVTFRSQNPRYAQDSVAPQKRAGLATIKVSSLSDAQLQGSLAIFLSGSYANNISRILENGDAVPLNGALQINSTSCQTYNVRLRISDARFNPLPMGTSLSAGTANKIALADIFPATVASVAPIYSNGYVSGDQGTIHLLPITPPNDLCVEGGGKTTTGTVMLQIKSPRGNVTLLPISMSFPSL